MLRFNFAEVKESAVEKYLKPDLIFLILVVLAALAAGFFLQKQLEEKIKRADAQIAELNAEIKRLKKIKEEENRLLKKKKELQRKLEIVSKLSTGREVPKPLYFFASRENVNGIWLDKLQLTGSTVKVEGNIWDVRQFPDFLKKVETQIGKVLFRQTKRVDYENKKLNFKTTFYKFEFGAEQGNGTAQ
jgi:type IV pilus assembly protein PilN